MQQLSLKQLMPPEHAAQIVNALADGTINHHVGQELTQFIILRNSLRLSPSAATIQAYVEFRKGSKFFQFENEDA